MISTLTSASEREAAMAISQRPYSQLSARGCNLSQWTTVPTVVFLKLCLAHSNSVIPSCPPIKAHFGWCSFLGVCGKPSLECSVVNERRQLKKRGAIIIIIIIISSSSSRVVWPFSFCAGAGSDGCRTSELLPLCECLQGSLQSRKTHPFTNQFDGIPFPPNRRGGEQQSCYLRSHIFSHIFWPILIVDESRI